MSSGQLAPPAEPVCYVKCSFCSIILAVSVPSTNLFNVVTVRCGHCSNLLVVNFGSLLQQPLQDLQDQNQRNAFGSQNNRVTNGASSKHRSGAEMNSIMENVDHQQMKNLQQPEKRQRLPSAYNRFIKEEIQRIKAINPDIRHREAFSAAAKNWAHFPLIHFGMPLEENKNKQVKLDEAVLHNKKYSAGFY